MLSGIFYILTLVQPPQKATTIPAGAHCNAVLPRTRLAPPVSVCAGHEKKWTRLNVTLKTSSNQQVDSSGLPRIW